MGWLDEIPMPDSPMAFEHGDTVYRLRAHAVDDRYSGKVVDGDWANADEVAMPGAFIDKTSTDLLADATREAATEARSLFCDSSFDIGKGDRIRSGSALYQIDGIPPEGLKNPFTGWTPPREIPLTRVVG